MGNLGSPFVGVLSAITNKASQGCLNFFKGCSITPLHYSLGCSITPLTIDNICTLWIWNCAVCPYNAYRILWYNPSSALIIIHFAICCQNDSHLALPAVVGWTVGFYELFICCYLGKNMFWYFVVMNLILRFLHIIALTTSLIQLLLAYTNTYTLGL